MTEFLLFCSCTSSSGICVCKTGVYGPKCDECHPGFFHFSSSGCRPCQCPNHTNYCHPQSGEFSVYSLLIYKPAAFIVYLFFFKEKSFRMCFHYVDCQNNNAEAVFSMADMNVTLVVKCKKEV